MNKWKVISIASTIIGVLASLIGGIANDKVSSSDMHATIEEEVAKRVSEVLEKE